MKKVILAIMVLLMPLNVLAYSSEVYLGGNTLGIEISSDGILIIGFYEINGKINKGNPKLKVGDYIKEVNGVEVNNLNELTKEIEKSKDEGKVTITGFVTFTAKEKAASTGRNPRTGETVNIPARTAVVIKAGSKLKEELN